MNKLGAVLGVAVVATLAGCKDPDYHRASGSPVQNEVKSVETSEATPAPVSATPAPETSVAQPVVKSCTCPPGTRHSSPCLCGAPDCQCVVEVKPVKPAEPETTTYIVQPGDYLSKISKKYNVTIASIKRLNGLKNDTIRVGQKLKLPGKIEVGEQKPVSQTRPAAQKSTAKKSVSDYTGATKEYVVKSGDTLGSIAYGNGINIRQLKKLNSLSKDTLRVGQKLKIPAAKVEKAVAKAAPKAEKAAEPAQPVAPVAAEPVAPAVVAPVAPAAEPVAPAAAPAAPVAEVAAPAPVAPAADAAPATINYVVRDTDDITDIAIRFGVSAAQIRELNNLGENDSLEPGKILKLPAEAQQ